MTFAIGTPHTRNAGYHWDGYGKGKEQHDVQTCPHCQAVILMQQWAKVDNQHMAGGFCTKCAKPICPNCQKRMQTEGCIPFLKKLEKEIDMTVKLNQFLKDAGMMPEPARPLFTGLILSE